MTIGDILNNATLEGNVRIQRWDEDKADMNVFYDDDTTSVAIPERVMDMEIKYIYPSTTINEYDKEVSVVVFEVE